MEGGHRRRSAVAPVPKLDMLRMSLSMKITTTMMPNGDDDYGDDDGDADDDHTTVMNTCAVAKCTWQ